MLAQSILIIDRFTDWLGRTLAWLTLLLVVNTGLVVLLRYGFGRGSIALQDSITYLHAAIFMLGAGYALKNNAHVRVDIFYRTFSAHTQAWINSLGTLLFLAPLCLLIGVLGWDFFQASWAIREGSSEPGGLPLVYLQKLLIPVMAVLVLLQALADLLRDVFNLMHHDPE